MKKELISKALGDINERHISGTMSYCPEKEKSAPGGSAVKSYRVVRRVLVLAAIIVLLLALGAVAYANGWLGLKPLVVTYTVSPPGAPEEEREMISLSGPQAVPETEISSDEVKAINKLAEKNRQAWAEFQEAQRNCPCVIEYNRLLDLVQEFSSGTIYHTELEENDDGTVTISYYLPIRTDYDNRGKANYQFDHSKEISVEEYNNYRELSLTRTNYNFECEYDFHYGLCCDNEKAMLEEVAAKYGLYIRPNTNRLVWSSETTGQTGPDYYTNQELSEMTAQFNKGNIFRETPSGFDKLYWYDDGTYGVSFYFRSPASGRELSVYGYNSVYSTLSTGQEAIGDLYVRKSYSTITHTCPDGTELEVCYSDEDAYFYVYLEDSFFSGHIRVNPHADDYDGSRTLTEEEICSALDSLNYSMIGRALQ